MPGLLTLVESPFKGRGKTLAVGSYEAQTDARLNRDYVRELCRCVAIRGDIPFASHIFCTEFLHDDVVEERAYGINIGFEWGKHAQQTVVGIDRGMSGGMLDAVANARDSNRPIVWLSLERWKERLLPTGVSVAMWRSLQQERDVVINHAGDLKWA
jgi:hypothetical protein